MLYHRKRRIPVQAENPSMIFISGWCMLSYCLQPAYLNFIPYSPDEILILIHNTTRFHDHRLAEMIFKIISSTKDRQKFKRCKYTCWDAGVCIED